MARKRDMDEMLGSTTKSDAANILPMFEEFRKELDEHHDRRERVIKASRDVTAASKKIIFAVQRARSLGQPLPVHITKTTKPFYDTIQARYGVAAPDMQGLNAWRYARNISSGNQEYIEAASFEHYVSTGKLLTYEQACQKLQTLWAEHPHALLSVEDYLLGIYDTTGELMRFAITCMATSGKLPSIGWSGSDTNMEADAVDAQRDILTDLRALKVQLEALDVSKASPFFVKDVRNKAEVMRNSVEKVEKAVYSLVIRGRERPKGWVPDADTGGGRREVDVEI